MEFSLILVGAVLVACLVPLLVWWRMRSRWRVAAADVRRMRRAWQEASAITDVHRRVLEAEKVFEMLLQTWGLEGTFAQKFTKVEWRFPEREIVWQAHRLRNRIAHDVGMRLSDAEARRAVDAFGKALSRHLPLS
ncbi:MAG: hypothetical protein G01um101425_513 [Candidatus Peregrinibacteria bacterium Gr01-1014_25]|nr:MAG: hypothetical protein G01um101425_513 [Candidatus Peregrinibacteria bacterium Gr01-1014_25]